MAVQKVKIHTIDQINEIIWNQKYDSQLKRNRSPYLYRGLSSKHYHLTTSLQRNCGLKKEALEPCILRNFTKYAAINDPILKTSIWRQMIIGQHHGLPTRLMDWTYSVLIALHFATSGCDLANMEDDKCILWQINIEEMNSRLLKRYREKLEEEKAFLMTVDMMDQLLKEESKALKRYDEDMENKSMVLLESPSVDQRIISQYSYFSVIPSEMEKGEDDYGIEKFLGITNNTVKYIIDAKLKWQIRDMLDQMNINERIVYPGLDGLTKWLTRHYYVRK